MISSSRVPMRRSAWVRKRSSVIPGREWNERTRNLEIPRCAIAHLRSGPSDHPGMTVMDEGQPNLHPKQPRIAGLDLFRHFLNPGGVFLHQLDVGDLAAARL